MLFPSKIIQGETIKDDLYYSEYSGSEWALTVEIRGAVSLTEISDYLNGYYSININTSSLTSGVYTYQVKVSNGTETYNIETGLFKVEADLSNISSAIDPRSHEQIMVDNIEAVLQGRATNDQKRIKINNREIEHHTLDELEAIREKYLRILVARQTKRTKKFRSIGYRF